RKNSLTSPLTNVKIGEQYVASLLRNERVNNNLFALLIAYNAGPGTLNRWQKKIDAMHDPLLFIELIPSAETRAFVERVMANLWIYRDQFGQEAPSLEAISQNVWPPYRALDN
ncbi:MAG: transglycosylase SLT domain-containing protein, partial [Bdellovibrionales bacterium]